MKEIKINIEGCMEDVAKVLKYLEQGGFLTQKNMSSGINKEGMNTTATYEVMPEDRKDRSEDRTEAELFMPKKGDVCTEVYAGENIGSIFIASGGIAKETYGCFLQSIISIRISCNIMRPLKLKEDDRHEQLACRPATSEEIDLLLKVLKDEGYFWDPIGCKRIKDKYVPKMGEWYFAPYVDFAAESPFSAIRYEWHGLDYDMDLLKKGWVFRTEEEAQALCDKLNKAIDGVEV